MGGDEPPVERHSPLARKFAHHRGSLPAGQGREYLRAGFRPGNRPALPQEHLRTLFPRSRHEGAGQRSGTGYFRRSSSKRTAARSPWTARSARAVALRSPFRPDPDFGVIFGGAAGTKPAAFLRAARGASLPAARRRGTPCRASAAGAMKKIGKNLVGFVF